ncbi:MAG: DNA polymerase I [Kiritimatiellia bacterium]
MNYKGKLVVIDLMPILYRGYFIFLTNPRKTATGVNTSSLSLFASTLKYILDKWQPTHWAIAMESESPTFRHKMYPLYKAQRDKMPEDIAASIGQAREFADAIGLQTLHVEGYEADDVLGTLAERGANDGFEVFVASPDKDLGQLVSPNIHLFRPGENKLLDEAEICQQWELNSPSQMIDYLALCGDASDNIPGVAGIGKKTAIKLLKEFGTVENLITHSADVAGRIGEKLRADTETLLLCKQLVTIARDVPLDFTWESLRVVTPDPVTVTPILRKYELNSIASQMGISLTAEQLPKKKPDQAEQLSLFGDEAPKISTGIENPLQNHRHSLADFPHDYRLITDATGREALATELLKAALVAVDTETTGLNPRKDRIVGCSFSVSEGRAWYVPLPEEHDAVCSALAPFIPLFTSETIAKVGHNLKFDRAMFLQYGIEFRGPLHDTLLAHYLLDATDRHDMDHLANAYLDYDPIPIARLIGDGKTKTMADRLPEEIVNYAAEDADVTLRLYHTFRPKLEANGLLTLLETCEEPLAGILLQMESVGVRIDTKALKKFRHELEGSIIQLEIAIREIMGAGVNIASPRQVGEFIFGDLNLDPSVKRSNRGQFPTNEETLLKIRDRHPIIDLLLDWRACVKLKNTYVDKLPDHIDPKDGRIHTTFNQSFTETGRLSSSHPNLQNIPVRSERGQRIRAVIVSREPGWTLLSADYSQVELRLMAAMSEDERMLTAFRHGEDIHAQTASAVYGIPLEDVTPQQRSHCKMVNFGIIYGISAFGLASRLRIARKDASELINTYFEKYPSVKAYMERTVAQATECGYAQTLFGRRRMLPDLSSRNGATRSAAARVAINMPIQGSAADIIKFAMVRIERELRAENLRTQMTLQIHDELLFDVPEDEVEHVRPLIQNAMENVCHLSIPLKVSIGIGTDWLTAH